MLQCHHCGATVEIHEPLARDSECESCRKDLRCCINCRHYDTRFNNACTENMADPVEDKARRNFCEYFYYSRTPLAAGGSGSTRLSDARAKLDALFRKPPKPD